MGWAGGHVTRWPPKLLPDQERVMKGVIAIYAH